MEKIVILSVLLPMISGMAVAIIPNKFIAWLFSIISILGNITLIVLCIYATYYGNNIGYNIGGWDHNYGIEININAVSSFLLLAISVVVFSIVFYSKNYLDKFFILDRKFRYFLSCIMFCYTGLSGILITNDIFNLYVFLEVSALSSYTLLSIGASKSALKRAFSYLIIGTIASTFYLFGVGIVYAASGSLNVTVIIDYINKGVSDNNLMMFGIVFMVISMLMKIAVFPFNFWVTKAYFEANNLVTAFLSGSSTKVMAFVLFKIFILINYSFGSSIVSKYISTIIIIIAFLSIFIGISYAFLSNQLKHILVYSSIAQTGYILLAITSTITINSNENMLYSMLAVVFMIASDSMIKTSIFVCEDIISNIIHDIHLTNIQQYNHRIPGLLKSFIYLNIMSLIGLPATLGFCGKIYLITSFVSDKIMLILISLCLAFSLIYCMKIVYCFYIKSNVLHLQNDNSLKNAKTDALNIISIISIAVPLIVTLSLGTFLSFESVTAISNAVVNLYTDL
ncbi:hypothetical protein GUI12_02660 [Anaplasmataceae bacterium AB001_6]|nr:hypothetical protein GUI12_02660 [Anaplasmataceae bacterium AB001_6]